MSTAHDDPLAILQTFTDAAKRVADSANRNGRAIATTDEGRKHLQEGREFYAKWAPQFMACAREMARAQAAIDTALKSKRWGMRA